jgi:hypothetical protein
MTNLTPEDWSRAGLTRIELDALAELALLRAKFATVVRVGEVAQAESDGLDAWVGQSYGLPSEDVLAL